MSLHVPVLPAESLHWLAPRPGMTVVDGTLGGGGHTALIAEAVGPSGRVISLDRDEAAVLAAAWLPGQVTALHANFGKLDLVLDHLGIDLVDGVLLDLGLSSDQLASPDRGFSYNSAGELDLRFDLSNGEPAWRMLQKLPEKAIADLIWQFGEERYSRRIARAIVADRRAKPVRTAAELAALVRRVVPRSPGHDIDPATRTFQALRIAVNDELGWIEKGIRAAAAHLRPGGRIVAISFHSLEDRIVKHLFREEPGLEVLTKKPVTASPEELAANPRSRSAKLRAAARRDR